jgi:hypothetical protein
MCCQCLDGFHVREACKHCCIMRTMSYFCVDKANILWEIYFQDALKIVLPSGHFWPLDWNCVVQIRAGGCELLCFIAGCPIEREWLRLSCDDVDWKLPRFGHAAPWGSHHAHHPSSPPPHPHIHGVDCYSLFAPPLPSPWWLVDSSSCWSILECLLGSLHPRLSVLV